ncbi:hypothetical protein [Bradyrhizobium cytisi]|uniref:Uncharacterized protein n=1 Tax=Bradyrhizobium cytisi TaxID=515489 RepID=A0A5S4WT01_9BRAD|nr:hypothetical protein [Bradyrhizobium cytisi]TYL85070.1 hypothetical protein FXB38_12315 [Bradyrhizobium cytisi]
MHEQRLRRADDIHCAVLGIADNQERDRNVFTRAGADIHQHYLCCDAHRGRQDQVRVGSGSSADRRGGVVASAWRALGDVLLKVGEKYRTFSAHREDRKKFDVEEGFYVRPPPPPPPSKQYEELPTQWDRTQQQTPLFEKCND